MSWTSADGVHKYFLSQRSIRLSALSDFELDDDISTSSRSRVSSVQSWLGLSAEKLVSIRPKTGPYDADVADGSRPRTPGVQICPLAALRRLLAADSVSSRSSHSSPALQATFGSKMVASSSLAQRGRLSSLRAMYDAKKWLYGVERTEFRARGSSSWAADFH